MKLKILMINYEFPPIGGGGANANLYLLKEFAKDKDIRIDLVTSSGTRHDYIDNFSDNITVHRLNIRKKRFHYWTQREILEFLYRSSRYVKRLLEKKTYDLCHAFFGFPSGYIAYRYRCKMPYMVSLRGSDVPGFNKRFSLQYVFLTPLFRKIWSEAEAVVANSRELRTLANKTMPELPVDVIYNGIDTDEFFPSSRIVPSPLEGEGQGEGEIKRKPFTILTVSRLIPRKCIDYLIRALPAVIASYPNVRLVIVGEGNMEDDLKKLTSDTGLDEKVSFMGRVEHDELPELYREADVFVLPSLWEGMSNTLLEAIASGQPVVVTDTGGTAELVKDIGKGKGKGRGRGNGIIIPKQDSKAISDAIIKLIDDLDMRRKMGARSREIALGFGWGKVAERYLEIYKESIKER